MTLLPPEHDAFGRDAGAYLYVGPREEQKNSKLKMF